MDIIVNSSIKIEIPSNTCQHNKKITDNQFVMQLINHLLYFSPSLNCKVG